MRMFLQRLAFRTKSPKAKWCFISISIHVQLKTKQHFVLPLSNVLRVILILGRQIFCLTQISKHRSSSDFALLNNVAASTIVLDFSIQQHLAPILLDTDYSWVLKMYHISCNNILCSLTSSWWYVSINYGFVP